MSIVPAKLSNLAKETLIAIKPWLSRARGSDCCAYFKLRIDAAGNVVWFGSKADVTLAGASQRTKSASADWFSFGAI
jgi:hypothetical protein